MNHPMGPQPYAPPPKAGMPAIVKVLIGIGAVLFLVMAAAFAVGLVVGFRRASRAGSARGGALPSVERHVPSHDASLLDGCSRADIDLVLDGIGSAIDVGAPLYNTGDFAGCYHLYDGAASDIARQLPAACAGPRQALAAGQSRASRAKTPSDQAWAMRDAFDGLLDVANRAP